MNTKELIVAIAVGTVIAYVAEGMLRKRGI